MRSIKGFSEFVLEQDGAGDLESLLKDMQGLGLSLSDEEKDMLDFVNQFGGGKSPDEYSEDIYDYYTNPEEYGIDKDGDYYDMLWYLYENSVEDHGRKWHTEKYYLSGEIGWDVKGIENEPLYKMYLKMSDYYNKYKR